MATELGANATDTSPPMSATSAPASPWAEVMHEGPSISLVAGVVLAITGNLVISIGLNTQKWVHNQNDARPESQRRPFAKNPIWWVGLIMTVVGEVGNFVAFGFAGADIVTPLGAVGVVANAVIACMFLGELFRIRDALGVLLTVVGSVLIVIKAPVNDDEMDVQRFLHYASNDVFVAYISVVLVLIVVLWRNLSRLQGRHPAYGLLLCSLMGTITVLCATAISHFIVSGDLGAHLTSAIPYVLVLILVPSAIGQVTFLNQTMELFDNTQVVPIYYILFTLSTITGSAMLYQDFYDEPADAIVMFVVGCLMCFLGVVLLTSGRIRAGVDSPTPSASFHVPSSEQRAQAGAEAANGGGDVPPLPSVSEAAHGAEAHGRRPIISRVRDALGGLDGPMPLPHGAHDAPRARARAHHSSPRGATLRRNRGSGGMITTLHPIGESYTQLAALEAPEPSPLEPAAASVDVEQQGGSSEGTEEGSDGCSPAGDRAAVPRLADGTGGGEMLCDAASDGTGSPECPPSGTRGSMSSVSPEAHLETTLGSARPADAASSPQPGLPRAEASPPLSPAHVALDDRSAGQGGGAGTPASNGWHDGGRRPNPGGADEGT